MRGIKQRNADNRIRGAIKKRSGGVNGNETCNNVKEANAGNEIRVTLAEIEISFHGKFCEIANLPCVRNSSRRPLSAKAW